MPTSVNRGGRRPACSWCGETVLPTHLTRDIAGRLYHNIPEKPCAEAFDDHLADFMAQQRYAEGA